MKRTPRTIPTTTTSTPRATATGNPEAIPTTPSATMPRGTEDGFVRITDELAFRAAGHSGMMKFYFSPNTSMKTYFSVHL
jgi:hypothetical protein